MNRFLATNRDNWNERVAIHLKDETGFYRVEQFRDGADLLDPIVDTALGPVQGLEIAHLQCHFGLDSLTLVRRGASVSGLDFAPAAIAAARQLAAETGLSARFFEANVFDAPAVLGRGRFDLVFVTWGALSWIDDISAWMAGAAALLKPGGRLFLAEVHPFLWPLEQEDGRLVACVDAVTPLSAPIAEEPDVTYTGAPDPLRHRRTYEWNHSMAGLFTALAGAGLRLTHCAEHDRLPWPRYPMMLATGDGLYRLPDDQPKLPLSYTLWAERG